MIESSGGSGSYFGSYADANGSGTFYGSGTDGSGVLLGASTGKLVIGLWFGGLGYYSTVYSNVYVGSGRKYYGSGSGGQFADFGPSGSGYYEYTSYEYAYGVGSFIDQSVAYTAYGSGDQNYVFDVGSFIVGSGEYYGSFDNPSNTSSARQLLRKWVLRWQGRKWFRLLRICYVF